MMRESIIEIAFVNSADCNASPETEGLSGKQSVDVNG